MMKRLKKFFIAHGPQVLFLLILFVILNFISEWPYFNLILNKTFIFALLWIISIFLFRLSGRFSIKVALVSLCFCLPLLILKQEGLIEKMGDLIYGLLLIGTIQEFIVCLKEKGNVREN